MNSTGCSACCPQKKIRRHWSSLSPHQARSPSKRRPVVLQRSDNTSCTALFLLNQVIFKIWSLADDNFHYFMLFCCCFDYFQSLWVVSLLCLLYLNFSVYQLYCYYLSEISFISVSYLLCFSCMKVIVYFTIIS